MANLADQQIFAAHTAKIYIDDQEVGFFQSVQIQENYGVATAFCIGSVEDQEHQQAHITFSGSAQRYYVRDLLIENSKLGARTAAEIIATGTFSLAILDDKTKQVVRRLRDVTLASQSLAINAGQMVSRNISFMALGAA